MSKKKPYFRLLALIPMLVLLTVTNFHVDPANLFHDVSGEIGRAIMNGQEAYFGSGNGNERMVKAYLIQNMPKHMDCLTIGPSLALGIRKSHVGTDSYYNLATSSMNYNDIMAEFALLDLNGVQYDRIILCVDSYFFDEKFASKLKNPEFLPYAEYMKGFLEGKNMPKPEEESRAEKIFSQTERLFSVSYFQSSADFIRTNDSFLHQPERWGIVNEETQDKAHYMSDASWVYARKYRENKVGAVLKHAKNYDLEGEFAYDRHLSDHYKEQFDLLIRYLKDRNVSVEFFLCPVCPALWERIENEKAHYPMLEEIETYVTGVAEKYGIKVTGSYDPSRVGITDEDYWDSRHIRHDRLEKYFDFTE